MIDWLEFGGEYREIGWWPSHLISDTNANSSAQLGRSPLEDWRQNLQLILMFKIVKKLMTVPPNNLDPADSQTRAHRPHKFCNIRTSTELYRNCFFPQTIPVWNKLYSDIVTSSTLACFKRRLS